MITGNNVAHDDLGTARRWRAALCLGLISSTFSTVVSQLTAARIGRDAAVDWMSVAAIPARDWALSVEPSVSAIAVGIAFHQSADISWALVFFGMLGKWTARLGPASLALAAVPWAILTSAFEWFIVVPLFPFWQPIFTLAAALLDRVSGPSLVGVHVSAIRVASSLCVGTRRIRRQNIPPGLEFWRDLRNCAFGSRRAVGRLRPRIAMGRPGSIRRSGLHSAYVDPS